MKQLSLATIIALMTIAITSVCPAQVPSLDRRLGSDIALTTLDGSTTTLKQHITKATVISFTTTWCADCKKLSEVLDRLMPRFTTQGIDFIFIYVGQRGRQVAKATGDSKVPGLPLRLLDVRRELSETLSITSVPSLFMVDASGSVRFEGFSIDEARLTKEMEGLVR